MDVKTAIDLVGQLTYKPGWSFEAHDHTRRFEDSITVTIHYPARNSNRDQAPDFPQEIMTYAKFPLVVSKCDETSLAGKVLLAIIAIEEHEAREFLRIKPTEWAPFHPHNVDGMERWERLHKGANPHMADLQFGLA